MSGQDEIEDTIDDSQAWHQCADIQEGAHIDRYQILGLLGKGGMGAVYKAYDPELDRSIAIKILTAKPHEGETSSRPQARLMREAQALAKLSHPNVVSVFDVGTYEEGVYIAMEYVKGKTLREWLQDEQPAMKEIIRTLFKAGQGLHAAHNEGIVHRDFKPDNVVIGDRGQVKVLDFGLARAAGTEDTIVPGRIRESVEESTSGEQLLSKHLTRVGAIIGTTVYMAPEHFQRQELDEKTDQFSFCVTLFEMLYGKRPFAGETSEELEENITSGLIETPQDSHIPKWMEEIIRKGLSISKADRYQSMAQLLDDLENDPEFSRTKRRRKLIISSVMLLLSALTLGFGYYAFFRISKVCTGGDKKVADVWDEEKKEIIHQAFAQTELSYAKDTFVRVAKRFDSYLRDWKNQYTETCEATRMRGEQSEEIMDLKMECLNRILRNAGALVNVLCDADKTVVSKSVQAVSSLSGLSNCNDTRALQSRSPPPKDEQTKNKVEAIRERLAIVQALSKTGKYKEGLELVTDLNEQACSIEYLPVQAESLYWLGEFLERVGEYKRAENVLQDAVLASGESRDSLLAAKAMALLVWVIGYIQNRHKEGILLSKAAIAMLGVAGGGKNVRSVLLNNLGVIFDKMGQHVQALEYYHNALAIREKSFGSEHPLVAISLNNIGLVFESQGQYQQALEYYRKSLAIKEKILGPVHPSVAVSLSNIGMVVSSQGDNEQSLVFLRKALTISEKALGSHHPSIAIPHTYLGDVLSKNGEYDKALEHFHKALAICKESMGSNNPCVAEPLIGIGTVLVNKGKSKQSLAPLERAAVVCMKFSCEQDWHVRGLFSLARSLVATEGDKERAIMLAKQARETLRKIPKRFEKEIKEVDAWLKTNAGSNQRSISTAKR